MIFKEVIKAKKNPTNQTSKKPHPNKTKAKELNQTKPTNQYPPFSPSPKGKEQNNTEFFSYSD